MTLIWENFDYQGKYTNASVSEAVQTSILNIKFYKSLCNEYELWNFKKLDLTFSVRCSIVRHT